ncbi:hypothetical protein N9W34_03895, partial [Rickettsiales bacterium]|nr:hypothetical protein [Rickettsiales bacterium]
VPGAIGNGSGKGFKYDYSDFLKVTELGAFKFHFAVEREKENLDKAVKLLKQVASTEEYEKLVIKGKYVDLSKDKGEGLRSGAEITVYICGNTELGTVEEANDLWVNFAFDVAEKFRENEIKASHIEEPELDMDMQNEYSTYRKGPNGAMTGRAEEAPTKCYDPAGNKIVNEAGEEVLYSYRYARKLDSCSQIPDYIYDALHRRDPGKFPEREMQASHSSESDLFSPLHGEVYSTYEGGKEKDSFQKVAEEKAAGKRLGGMKGSKSESIKAAGDEEENVPGRTVLTSVSMHAGIPYSDEHSRQASLLAAQAASSATSSAVSTPESSPPTTLAGNEEGSLSRKDFARTASYPAGYGAGKPRGSYSAGMTTSASAVGRIEENKEDTKKER